MMKRGWISGLVVLCTVSGLLAQAPNRQRMQEMMARHNVEFLDTAPRIGEPLPEVVAYDEREEPFRLDRLKGNYSVLIFGCLT